MKFNVENCFLFISATSRHASAAKICMPMFFYVLKTIETLLLRSEKKKFPPLKNALYLARVLGGEIQIFKFGQKQMHELSRVLNSAEHQNQKVPNPFSTFPGLISLVKHQKFTFSPLREEARYVLSENSYSPPKSTPRTSE